MTDPSSACHAEGRGFESLQPLSKRPAFAGLFRGRSRLVRLRHRTMTGQSCPWRLASALGRCSLAGDSERPAPWNFCLPVEDRDRPRRIGAPAPPAPLRLVRGRNAAFVEEQHFPGRASDAQSRSGEGGSEQTHEADYESREPPPEASPRSASARWWSQYWTSRITLPLRTWNRLAAFVQICRTSTPLALPRPLKWLTTRTRSPSSSRYSSASTRSSSHGLRMPRQASAIPASPTQLPGAGPSSCTYSISGSAQSAER